MIAGVKGIHHVGIGVKDFMGMRQYYAETLDMRKIYNENFELWNAMPETFRTSYHRFSETLRQQEAGGIITELIGMTLPMPKPIRDKIRYGDIGVNKMTIAVRDVEQFFKKEQNTIDFVSKPQSVPLPQYGDYDFIYGRDPEGNLIEFISRDDLETEDVFGGVQSLGVSVTDLERSREFYQSLAFDQVVIGPHERFSGHVDDVAGERGTQVRSCVLENSNGGGKLELYEMLRPRGRSIRFNTHWGDFGFMEVCLYADDIHGLANKCREKDMEFLHAPYYAFDVDAKQVWFMYVYDPDGIPVEALSESPRAGK